VLPKENVRFRTGQDLLDGSSYRLLDSIAQVLVDAPTMRLRIEGHTDSEGGERTNLALSQDRALAVRTYLVGQGIEPTRLEADGFGETRPIDTNRTSRGRSKNRRVEFHIIR
jgi:outer membrane protein OmpA-like peptidoglycan-associated protein